jgi:hypothetical protein
MMPTSAQGPRVHRQRHIPLMVSPGRSVLSLSCGMAGTRIEGYPMPTAPRLAQWVGYGPPSPPPGSVPASRISRKGDLGPALPPAAVAIGVCSRAIYCSGLFRSSFGPFSRFICVSFAFHFGSICFIWVMLRYVSL